MKGSDIFMAFDIHSWAAFPKGHMHSFGVSPAAFWRGSGAGLLITFLCFANLISK